MNGETDHLTQYWFGPLRAALETVEGIEKEVMISVSSRDWREMVSFASSHDRVRDLCRFFYSNDTVPDPSGPMVRSPPGLIRNKNALRDLSDDAFWHLYQLLYRRPDLTFPDVHHIFRTSKTQAKVMTTVLQHVVAWVNPAPYRPATRGEQGKPGLYQDLVPALEHRYGEDGASVHAIRLQRVVLDYALAHYALFTDSTNQPLLTAFPDDDHPPDMYVTRFSHSPWAQLRQHVSSILGPHFQGPTMARFNQPATTPPLAPLPGAAFVAAYMAQSTTNLPEILANSALAREDARVSLSTLITPVVERWIREQCPTGVAHGDAASATAARSPVESDEVQLPPRDDTLPATTSSALSPVVTGLLSPSAGSPTSSSPSSLDLSATASARLEARPTPPDTEAVVTSTVSPTVPSTLTSAMIPPTEEGSSSPQHGASSTPVSHPSSSVASQPPTSAQPRRLKKSVPQPTIRTKAPPSAHRLAVPRRDVYDMPSSPLSSVKPPGTAPWKRGRGVRREH